MVFQQQTKRQQFVALTPGHTDTKDGNRRRKTTNAAAAAAAAVAAAAAAETTQQVTKQQQATACRIPIKQKTHTHSFLFLSKKIK